MRKLSVTVITFNEEANIARCLGSVQDIADEIVVVDSFSTDDTREIASNMGAKVIQNDFGSYSAQRAFASRQATHDMILAMDADEYLSEELRESIKKVLRSDDYDCYTFNRLNRIGKTWIRCTSWYPDRKLRLFDRNKIQFSDKGGHDNILPKKGAKTRHLNGDLLHHTSRDLADRISQVNRLSSASARYLFEERKKGSWLRLLFKPTFRFFMEFVVHRGFAGGFYGLTLSYIAAYYVFLREAKLIHYNKQEKLASFARRP